MSGSNNIKILVGGDVTTASTTSSTATTVVSTTTSTVSTVSDTITTLSSLKIVSLGTGKSVYSGKGTNGADVQLRSLSGTNGITVTTDTLGNMLINGATGAGTGTVTSITAGSGLSGGSITSNGTISLANTSVTPGSYTNANITIDATGRITAASNGTSSGGGVGTVTSVSAGVGLTGGTITSSGTISLPVVNSTVGSFTNASITVDSYGRVTHAATGSGGSAAIAGLSDVALTTLTDGQVLTYSASSSRWTNSTPSGSANNVTKYAFTINFVGTDPATFSNVPNGWTVTTPSTGVILIVHNLGKQPAAAMFWGTGDGSNYQSRQIGSNGLYLSYTSASATTTTQIQQVSTTSTASADGFSAILELLF